MRWLCIDPGTKRTGVAVSSPEGTFAVPLLVLEHDAAGPRMERVAGLMSEYGARGLVIGLPLYMDGSSSAQTLLALELARRIAAHLNARLEMPVGVACPESASGTDAVGEGAPAEATALRVVLWDERLSSWEAQRARDTGGANGRKPAVKKKVALDAHAAAIILQSFLDANSPAPARESRAENDAEELADRSD
jgi:putative transcription antitermination factor YqgF